MIDLPINSHYSQWRADPKTFLTQPKASLQQAQPQDLVNAGMSPAQWSRLRADVEAAFEPARRDRKVRILWPIASVLLAVTPLIQIFCIYSLVQIYTTDEADRKAAREYVVDESALVWAWLIGFYVVRRYLLPPYARLAKSSCSSALEQICLELNTAHPSLSFSAGGQSLITYSTTESESLSAPVSVMAVPVTAVPVAAVAVPVAVGAAQPAEELNWEAQRSPGSSRGESEAQAGSGGKPQWAFARTGAGDAEDSADRSLLRLA